MAAFGLGGGTGYEFMAMTRSRRQAPPHPLGDDAKCFAYGAATPRDPDAGRPGWEGVQVKVDPAPGGGVYMSGDEVVGSVVVGKRPNGVSGDAQGTLTVKLYFESRTLYFDDERAFAEQKSLHKTGQSLAQMPTGHEYHRGLAHSFTHRLHSSTTETIPFTIPVPATVTVTESSTYVDAKGQKTPPRKFCDVPRSPPPTLRNFINGSVEWVVEAVLAYPGGRLQVDGERGFLLPSPPETFVSRAVFPFLPKDAHLLPLFDFAPPSSTSSAVPTFGPDPLSRIETGGAVLRPPVGFSMETQLAIRKAIEAGRPEDIPPPQPMLWVKEAHLETKFGTAGGAVKVQTEVRDGGRVERNADELVIKVRMDFPHSAGGKLLGKFLGGSGKSKASHSDGDADPGKGRLGRIGVVLTRRVLTRGGREEEGHMVLEEVRRADYQFPPFAAQHKSSADPGISHRGLEVVAAPGEEEEGKVEVLLKLDLQGGGTIVKRQTTKVGESSAAKAKIDESVQIPGRTLVPSFRTPNIEVEYICTVNIVPLNQPLFCAARFPLQFLTGTTSSLSHPNGSSSSAAQHHHVVALSDEEAALFDLPPAFDGLHLNGQANGGPGGGEELPKYGS